MAADHLTTLRIPITGRCGDRRILRGWVLAPNDAFCRGLLRHSWNLNQDGYPNRHNTSGSGICTIFLHRVIFERYHGPVPDGMEIDHINRDKWDNLPGNLRAITHAHNIMNVGKRRDNTSGFVGVHWYRQCKRWGAKINANGQRLYLGVFLTAKEAAVAVNAAYAIHHPHVPPPNRID